MKPSDGPNPNNIGKVKFILVEKFKFNQDTFIFVYFFQYVVLAFNALNFSVKGVC